MGTGKISGTVGGVPVDVRVPVGADAFNIPADMAETAGDLLAAMSKAAGGRTWRKHLETPADGGFTLPNTGWYSINYGVNVPVWPKAFVLLRGYVKITASNIGGNEGPAGAHVDLRFRRWAFTGESMSGRQTFPIPGNGEWWIAHTWLWDNSEGTNTQVSFHCDINRSSDWTCVMDTRQFDVFMIERPAGDTSARDLAGAPSQPVSTDGVSVAPMYTTVANGVVTYKQTDLAWLRKHVTPDAPVATFTAAPADGDLSVHQPPPPAASTPVVLGDGTKAVWANGTWTTA